MKWAGPGVRVQGCSGHWEPGWSWEEGPPSRQGLEEQAVAAVDHPGVSRRPEPGRLMWGGEGEDHGSVHVTTVRGSGLQMSCLDSVSGAEGLLRRK